MSTMYKILIISILFLSSLNGQNTVEYPKDYFRSPLDIPLFLAGNFGELRSNHFHAGIDIKTQGVEGFKVYASAAGYISRIKVQHYGYGKVLYLTHSNGYTTVYAHLKKFSPKIEAYIKKHQYKKETYTIEKFPAPNELTFEKGEVIAISGNSGGSGGPHLHFEIRESKTENPVNPLLFGFNIKDNIKPIIKGIRIYPLDSNSYLGTKPNAQYLTAIGEKGKYKLRFQDTIRVHGKIALGIETLDKLNGAGNRCGVFDIQLYKNSELIYEQNMTCIPFSESRYINSHTEYGYKKDKNKWIHKSYIDPNNHLSIYKKHENHGIMEFYENSRDTMTYVITDVYNNQSTLSFILTGKAKELIFKTPIDSFEVANLRYPRSFNHFENDIQVNIPANSVYRDLPFRLERKPSKKGDWTPRYKIMDLTIPVHKKYTISLKPDTIIDSLKSKYLMASEDKWGNLRAEGGKWNKDRFETKTRSFGTYVLRLDTIDPTIKGFNIYNGKNIGKQSTLAFTIQDNFSGIESYRCLVDGKWVLFEYDYKKRRLSHYLDGTITKGKHNVSVQVIDNRGNKTIKTYSFLLL